MYKIDRIIPFVWGFLMVSNFHYSISDPTNHVSLATIIAAVCCSIILGSINIKNSQHLFRFTAGAVAAGVVTGGVSVLFRPLLFGYLFLVSNLLVFGVVVLTWWLSRVTSSPRSEYGNLAWRGGLALLAFNISYLASLEGSATWLTTLMRILIPVTLPLFGRFFYRVALYRHLKTR